MEYIYPHVGNDGKYEYSSEESNFYPHGQSSFFFLPLFWDAGDRMPVS